MAGAAGGGHFVQVPFTPVDNFYSSAPRGRCAKNATHVRIPFPLPTPTTLDELFLADEGLWEKAVGAFTASDLKIE